MLRRKWFFWIDRLKITRHERISIMVLVGISIGLGIFSWWYEPRPPYGDDHYRELDQFFERRLKAIEKEEARIMARYARGAPSSSENENGSTSNRVNDSIRHRNGSAVSETEGRMSNSARASVESGSGSARITKTGTDRTSAVHINKAGIDALQTLPGIGPALARRIISYREREGSFERVAELINVKGIGSVTLENMRPYLRELPDRQHH